VKSPECTLIHQGLFNGTKKMTKGHHSLKDLNVTKQAKQKVHYVMALP
jgi:hypothetical protein